MEKDGAGGGGAGEGGGGASGRSKARVGRSGAAGAAGWGMPAIWKVEVGMAPSMAVPEGMGAEGD
jgi:hypothetical protein